MIMSKEVRKSLKQWEPMSEQIISARFKCQNITIIQVCALHTAFNKRKTGNLTMIIGYINAKVGSDNRNWEASMGSDP